MPCGLSRPAAKAEAVEQLASGIAHDFNNLVTAISGTAELLRNLEDQRVGHYALRIQSAAAPAARLAEKMLTNDTELTQVPLNLVLNARDALRPGETGRIRLEVPTGEGQMPEGKLVIGAIPTVPSVLIRVSDTGYVIEPEELGKVFEPFFTRKRLAGTGLGLAVVAGIIAGNHGALTIQSWPGVGTIFEVWWPLQAQAGDASMQRDGFDLNAMLTGKTVLVVDDNPAVVDTLVATLDEVGAEAGPCLDPRDAIIAIEDDAAMWDLAITDYDMPIMLLTALPRIHRLHQKQVGLFGAVLGKPAGTAQLAASAAAAMTAARERTTKCVS